MDILFLFFIIVAAILPGIIWMVFFLSERVHPEPKKMVAYTFFVGMLVSVPVIVLQIIGRDFAYYIYSYGGAITTIGIAMSLMLLFYPAFVEEFFKFVATAITVGGTKFIKIPVDAMIFMIVAGLGMATFENVVIATRIVSDFGQTGAMEAVDIIILRFVGATLLHALASAIIGYYWAKSKLTGKRGPLWRGLLIASLIHSLFNYLIIKSEPADYLIIPSLFLIGVAFFVFEEFDELRMSFVEFPENNEG